jgi:hypothetical protein
VDTLVEDTLSHGETLLVVSSGDLEDVALELVAEGVDLDLCAHTLIEEDSALLVIVDLDCLLGSS